MIHPVILAGGSGTRLWPVSRKSYPKQFSTLIEGGTLFQRAVRRVTGPGFAAPIIVTSDDFRFIVPYQLAAIGVDDARGLVEPMPRNTCPAILAAAHLVGTSDDPEAQLLVCPSDQLIADDTAFKHAVGAASEAAARGRIVTFGVQPDRVETGYGYLEPVDSADLSAGGAHDLERYIEKPPAEVAE
ncbi:MAG: sugar phosphate nucleotidyltransferase, partial [Planctomycetota bacterium]|nr:sugar phosphate nucleotidyltransferase [Planctomycetota bacterium]